MKTIKITKEKTQAHKPLHIGQTSGLLTVVKKTDMRATDGSVVYLCKCKCGNTTLLRSYQIRRSLVGSCGCMGSRQSIGSRSLRHGHAVGGKTSKTYRVWVNMINRCNNPGVKSYKYYGARGITVCKRWLKFENFLHDMGDPPSGLTIDRINNDKNYCKSNCRWATRRTQRLNQRRMKQQS